MIVDRIYLHVSGVPVSFFQRGDLLQHQFPLELRPQPGPKSSEGGHRFLVDVAAYHQVVEAGDVVGYRSVPLVKMLPFVENHGSITRGNEFDS